MSFLPSLAVLGVIALLAGSLTLRRSLPGELPALRRKASFALALATAAQTIHFIEELRSGFAASFPGMFGLAPIPTGVFLGFNLAWIGIWIVSVPGLLAGHRWALFAAFFLALAGLLNGVAHPLLTLINGAYFPGLYTSSLVFLASIFLLHHLLRSTVQR